MPSSHLPWRHHPPARAAHPAGPPTSDIPWPKGTPLARGTSVLQDRLCAHPLCPQGLPGELQEQAMLCLISRMCGSPRQAEP